MPFRKPWPILGLANLALFKIDLKGTHHHISYISICQLKYFLGKAVGAALGVEGLPVNLELQV